jgi:hypothetical protein
LVRSYPHAALAKSCAADENALLCKEKTLAAPAVSSTVSSNSTAPTTYADLARVVELWPVLPPAIRAAIVTLANTTAPSAPLGTTAEEQLDKLPPGYEKRPGG